MSQLPAEQAIVRFKANEERVDNFVNSSGYVTSNGIVVQGLPGKVDELIYAITSFNARGDWLTATAYSIKDLVKESGTWYVAVVAHTSGATFAGDVATKWRVFQGITSGDLSADDGAEMVGFKQPYTDAVTRNAYEKFTEFVSPEDFGATGDGIANDSPAWQKCIAAWELNRSLQINAVNDYNLPDTLYVANLETDVLESRLRITGGGKLIKNNAGFMFDKPLGQALQTGHIFFDGVHFEGAKLNGLTFILNGDNVIRTHFINCFGFGINVVKATDYFQTIYCAGATTFREWNGYLFDCGNLFDFEWDGIAEHGDGFLITRNAAADPACNSLKLKGNIEGLSGVSGPAINVGVCWASSIKELYCEQNAGGDIDCSGGTGFHKGLTIQNCGFQPTSGQLSDPNYFPVITGKGAGDAITLIGNASTGNLFDVTVGNESAIVDSGNFAGAGYKKFSDTSNRRFSFSGTKFNAQLLPGYGVFLESFQSSVGFNNTQGTVVGETVAAEQMYGPASPQVSPGTYGRKWQKGSIVWNIAPTVEERQYGVGTVHDALIMGWICITAGEPGLWREIAVMLPY